MKWKYWLLGGFLGISTASQAHEQYEEDSDSARTPKQETLAKIPGHSRPAYNAAEYNTDSLAPKRAASPADTVQTGTVSPHAADTSAIRFSADTAAIHLSDNTSATRFSADTLAANAFPADSLAADTLLSPHDRFVAAEEDMLLLISPLRRCPHQSLLGSERQKMDHRHWQYRTPRRQPGSEF